MIASLTGTVHIFDSKVIITTAGVGYLVHVTNRVIHTASRLSDGQELQLYIYTHVKEDALDLYGFTSWQERSLFVLFLSVSGIGPNTAIHILDHDLPTVTRAIQEADVSFFTKIPRIGKKGAQKIIIELGSKLGEVKSLELGPQSESYLEIRESLVGLGFNESAVDKALRTMDLREADPAQVIKDVIKLLGVKK